MYRAVAAVLFTTVVLPILYVVEPFWRIRIGFFIEGRIGHLSTDVELYLRRQRMSGPRPRTTVFFIVWNPANQPLLDMWKRRLDVIESRWLRRASYGFEPILRRTRFFEPIPVNEPGRHELFKDQEPTLSFTADEESRGRALLDAMGIGDDDWFVCFHTRDSAYLATREGFGDQGDWQDGNSYRNCSIENYLDAATWIAEQGGYAVRMGSAVLAPLSEGLHPRIIDYASHFRSPFGDIYLPAKCRFFLGGAAGLNNISMIFNVPIALANWATYHHAGHGPNNIYNPKLLRRATGEWVSFPELKRMGFFDLDWRNDSLSALAARMELRWVENTAQEVLGICMDMMEKLDGVEPTAEIVRLQQIYDGLYPEGESGPMVSRIAPRFAMQHVHLIEPGDVEGERPRGVVTA